MDHEVECEEQLLAMQNRLTLMRDEIESFLAGTHLLFGGTGATVLLGRISAAVEEMI